MPGKPESSPAPDADAGAVFDPETTYLHLADGPAATPIPVTGDFWQTINQRADLAGGRLVSAYHFTEDWPHWERHPAGDEIIVQIAGAMDLVLDVDGTERRVRLRGRSATVVPRGTWHRAIVHEPTEALFITRGDGTEHRPVET